MVANPDEIICPECGMKGQGFHRVFCSSSVMYAMQPTLVLGWECPKCGQVWAPQVHACPNCAANVAAGTIIPCVTTSITFTPLEG